MPSLREYFGFQPKEDILEISITFLGVPSGLEVSKLISPSNPMTSTSISTRLLIVTTCHR